MRLFPQARADGLQHLHSFSLLIAASEGAIFATSGGHTANAQWRRVAQQQARTTQPIAPERSLAARNVRRAGKDEANWLRREYSPAPREANRFSPCGHPHRAFPVTRRWVPWHPIPPCSPKKGDTRASSRDPQSILGLPSASFLLLTRHFMERKPLFAK